MHQPLPWAHDVVQEVANELLSPNLHHLICVLTEQALALGDTHSVLEFWVERMMQLFKSCVSGGTTQARSRTLLGFC
jgi:hypothetical protein